jgi:hypothetical protein
MVSSNGVMGCPGGKSCHIPAVCILSEAELLNAAHVTVSCNVHHEEKVFSAIFFYGETDNHSSALSHFSSRSNEDIHDLI